MTENQIPIFSVCHTWDDQDDDCYSQHCECCGVCDCFGAEYEYLASTELSDVENYVCFNCKPKCEPKEGEGGNADGMILFHFYEEEWPNVNRLCSRCQTAYTLVRDANVSCLNQDYINALNLQRDKEYKQQDSN